MYASGSNSGASSADAQLRSPAVAVLLGQLVQLRLDHAPQLRFRGQDGLDAARLGRLLLQLVEDLLDLHLGDLVELGVEDGVGLDLVELERLDQLLGGVRLAAALADQLDRLVQGVEDDAEPFEDVDALAQLFQLVLEAPPHRRQAEVEEVAQNLLQAERAAAAASSFPAASSCGTRQVML